MEELDFSGFKIVSYMICPTKPHGSFQGQQQPIGSFKSQRNPSASGQLLKKKQKKIKTLSSLNETHHQNLVQHHPKNSHVKIVQLDPFPGQADTDCGQRIRYLTRIKRYFETFLCQFHTNFRMTQGSRSILCLLHGLVHKLLKTRTRLWLAHGGKRVSQMACLG